MAILNINGNIQVKLNKIFTAMGMGLIMVTGAANASSQPSDAEKTVTVNGGAVHFKGKVVAAPCSVSTDSSD